MHAWRLAFCAIALPLLAGCGGSGPDGVIVKLHAARNGDTCAITADVSNNTKYHFEGAEVHLGTGDFGLSELSANSQGSLDVWSYDIPVQTATCEDAVADIAAKAPAAKASRCVMDQVPEGDCQNMVHVVADFDAAKVAEFDRQASAARVGGNLALNETRIVQGTGGSIGLFNDDRSANGEQAVQTGDALQVVELRQDKYGAALWYRIAFHSGQTVVTGSNTEGWVTRAAFDQFAAEQHLATPAQVEQQQRAAAALKAASNLKVGQFLQQHDGMSSFSLTDQAGQNGTNANIWQDWYGSVLAVETDKYGVATRYDIRIANARDPSQAPLVGWVTRDAIDQALSRGLSVGDEPPAGPPPPAAPPPPQQDGADTSQ